MIMLATSFNNQSDSQDKWNFIQRNITQHELQGFYFLTHGHSVIQPETPKTISLCSPNVSPGHSVSVPRTSASERHPAAWSVRRRRVPKS